MLDQPSAEHRTDRDSDTGGGPEHAERLAALAFQYGGRFYNYQGLRRYKEKFEPEWIGSYLAYPRGSWVPGLLIDIAALVAGGYRRFVFGGAD